MSCVLYVISDLHIGGDYPDSGNLDSRGFRICTRMSALTAFVRSISRPSPDASQTELVINGDFIDFLAERRRIINPFSGTESLGWSPFITDPEEASDILKRIVERDKPFFTALSEFIECGHRLTIMLGNHDIELSLPEVRKTLHVLLNVDKGKFTFIYDGEAYAVGNVLIEHGNRYDEWNVVSHGALRQLRSMQTRKEQPANTYSTFEAPAGSYMVAAVINHIKKDYPFIDLLKPETAAALPILLALAPEYRSHLSTVARFALRTIRHGLQPDGVPMNDGDIADASNDTAEAIDPLDIFLGQTMDAAALQELKCLLSVRPQGSTFDAGDGDIGILPSLSTWARLWLCTVGTPKNQQLREQLLRIALGAVAKDYSFDRTKELAKYQEPAERLMQRGFKAVVFGHTHLAKEIRCNEGVYLNCGTWADLIRIPDGCLDTSASSGNQTRLRDFVADLAASRLARHVCFIPTYVRLELNERQELLSAALCDFPWEGRANEEPSETLDRQAGCR